MDSRPLARALFTLVAAMAAGVLVFAVRLMPEQWTTAIVLWLLVGLPIMLYAGRVFVRATRYRATRPPAVPSSPRPPRPLRRASPGVERLRVVLSDSAGRGRYVIR